MRCVVMPKYVITLNNDEFSSSTEQELADASTAGHEAIKGALDIGVSEVMKGKPFFGAEGMVTDGGSRERFVVSVAASRLI